MDVGAALRGSFGAMAFEAFDSDGDAGLATRSLSLALTVAGFVGGRKGELMRALPRCASRLVGSVVIVLVLSTCALAQRPPETDPDQPSGAPHLPAAASSAASESAVVLIGPVQAPAAMWMRVPWRLVATPGQPAAPQRLRAVRKERRNMPRRKSLAGIPTNPHWRLRLPTSGR